MTSTSPMIPKLRSLVSGRVIDPHDTDYDTARATFYSWFDRKPSAIVRVANATDVKNVILFARNAGLDLAVRSGGHSGAGHCVVDGGIVVDVSAMKAIDIDPRENTAWAETGLTAGEYTTATSEHGLLTGFGDTGSVGIGGITVGGGIGFLVRKYGLTIDDLLAAEMVTADGKELSVDSRNHPDLFWAIRGGGGNFGVVTRFKFRLHKIDNILGGMLFQPATPDAIKNLIDESEAAPEELSIIANVMTAPPMPFLPAEYHGKPLIMSMLVYAGPPDKGEPVVARLKAIAKPVVDMVRPMRYKEMYGPDGPHPAAASFDSMFADRFDLSDAQAILDALRRSKASMAVAQLRTLGGAMARVPRDATAFAHRSKKMLVNVAALYENPKDAPQHELWVRQLSDILRKGDDAVYVNFLGDAGEARVSGAYPGDTYRRLAAVKATYDPENIFRVNHNIKPLTGKN